MDSDLQSSPSENGGAKAAFRKPSNDASHRKYRHRSPVDGPFAPNDGHNRERSFSPIRQDTSRNSDDQQRKDDGRDIDRHYSRSGQYSRSGDSYRHSDRQFSRSSSNYRKDDIIKHEKHADEVERSKPSFHSSSHTRRESEHDRSKDHSRTVAKYSNDKSESLGYRSSRNKEREGSSLHYRKYKDVEDGDGDGDGRSKRSYGPRKGDRSPTLDEGKGHWSNLTRDAERDQSLGKKPKMFSERDIEHGKVSKFTNKPEEKQQSSISKHVQDFAGKVTSEQDFVKDSDIDAAKVAAIKAAELVNRNLVGTGYMSTDQKKKLLWGSKKATTTEEPAHRWDASLSLFPDQERQEKFKKLMSLRLHWYLWAIVGCEGRGESGEQWAPTSRGEAEGTPARLGEAIHCRSSPERWAYCWFRSLISYLFSSTLLLPIQILLLNVVFSHYCILCASRRTCHLFES